MACSSSLSGPSVASTSLMEDGRPRNWAELPQELTAAILLRLGAIEILTSAQMVCRAWRCVSKDQSMWRKIAIGSLGSVHYDPEILCRHAVDRSLGGLVDINIEYFGTDSLLTYIADRSSRLRRLRLACCYAITDEGFVNAGMKLPLLEDVEIAQCSLSADALKAVGRSWPLLKTFKLIRRDDKSLDSESDDDAIAVAESMPELRYLQLFGNALTDTGLTAILDNCRHLEHLDLRKCFNIYLVGALKKRCYEQIKDVRHPTDLDDAFSYDPTVGNMIQPRLKGHDGPCSCYRYDYYDEDMIL